MLFIQYIVTCLLSNHTTHPLTVNSNPLSMVKELKYFGVTCCWDATCILGLWNLMYVGTAPKHCWATRHQIQNKISWASLLYFNYLLAICNCMKVGRSKNAILLQHAPLAGVLLEELKSLCSCHAINFLCLGLSITKLKFCVLADCFCV